MQSNTEVKGCPTILLTIVIIAIINSSGNGEDTATTLTPCRLHDPNNGPCLKELWQNILIAGIQDVPGVKWISLEPYKVPKVRVAVHTPLIRLTINLMDIEITGLPESTILDASASEEELFQLHINIPKLHIQGKYSMVGRILLLSLDGEGTCEIEITDIDVSFRLKAKAAERDGELYFEPQSLKSDVRHVGNIEVQFNNLFGIYQELTDSANAVFNQNWSDLVEIMRPVILETMEKSLMGQAKLYLGNLPARIAFSDLP